MNATFAFANKNTLLIFADFARFYLHRVTSRSVILQSKGVNLCNKYISVLAMNNAYSASANLNRQIACVYLFFLFYAYIFNAIGNENSVKKKNKQTKRKKRKEKQRMIIHKNRGKGIAGTSGY